MCYFFPYSCCYWIATFKNLNSHAYYSFAAVRYFHFEHDVKVNYLFNFDIKTHFFEGKTTGLDVDVRWVVCSDCLSYIINYHIIAHFHFDSVSLHDNYINGCSFFINLIKFKYYNNFTYF